MAPLLEPDDSPTIKLEDSPSPKHLLESHDTHTQAAPTLSITAASKNEALSNDTLSVPSSLDPKDPEGYLKRCSGYNKRTRKRCAAIIGTRNSHSHLSTDELQYLPVCHSHKDQLQWAGRCRFGFLHGEQCGRLFRWFKPLFELCPQHRDAPDTPCYLMKLPLELRHDIFRYLLPEGRMGSTASGLPHPPVLPHISHAPRQNSRASVNNPYTSTLPGLPYPGFFHSKSTLSPQPICNILQVNRQIYNEAKDLLYGTVPFTIDIRRDGTFMCGRRLLEPRTADGVPRDQDSDSAGTSKKLRSFLATFPFGSVKNYCVDILVENHSNDRPHWGIPLWDEEVEIYDIRDYIGVAVSGILAKSHSLCRLNVRIGLSNFQWSEQEMFENIRRLIEPFERLRNVRQPKLCGIYDATPLHPYMILGTRLIGTCYTIPQFLPVATHLVNPESHRFKEFKKSWECCIAGNSPPPRQSVIKNMFIQLKMFYTKLYEYLPEIERNGRNAFLHRARIARETEDVEAFREVRNELIMYWNQYLANEEAKKDEMNKRLSRMLDSDSCAPSQYDPSRCRRSNITEPQSPNLLELHEASNDLKEHVQRKQQRALQAQGMYFAAQCQQQLRQQQMMEMQRHASSSSSGSSSSSLGVDSAFCEPSSSSPPTQASLGVAEYKGKTDHNMGCQVIAEPSLFQQPSMIRPDSENVGPVLEGVNDGAKWLFGLHQHPTATPPYGHTLGQRHIDDADQDLYVLQASTKKRKRSQLVSHVIGEPKGKSKAEFIEIVDD